MPKKGNNTKKIVGGLSGAAAGRIVGGLTGAAIGAAAGVALADEGVRENVTQGGKAIYHELRGKVRQAAKETNKMVKKQK